MVERGPEKAGVGGSIPSLGIFLDVLLRPFLLRDRDVRDASHPLETALLRNGWCAANFRKSNHWVIRLSELVRVCSATSTAPADIVRREGIFRSKFSRLF